MKRNVRLRCPFRKGTCEITRKTRRQCQACRLRKCLESGMKKESECGRATPVRPPVLREVAVGSGGSARADARRGRAREPSVRQQEATWTTCRGDLGTEAISVRCSVRCGGRRQPGLCCPCMIPFALLVV
jgi:hypothetical protein